MPLIRNLTLEGWIEHAFDHPDSDRDWHTRRGSGHWADDSAVKAAYMAETFDNPDRHIARFSDRQLETALWFILTQGYFDEALEGGAPLENRIKLVRSTENLFRKLFAVRCHGVDFGGNKPLYRICYMFWEILPLANRSAEPDEGRLAEEKMTVMEGLLDCDEPMCQYSALHGLGHAQADLPERVGAAVDRYLARHPEPDFELRNYALAARKGGVQ